ncbi:hypothetical protein SUGI_0667920 [Cryptomeria japonica]|uniref:ferritin-like catalase Nec2 n=1 Tax=Cryptomeria japonica TaxID=3369 RepID=UPI002414A955|nr:ferritin-like catalase Nec2 [Cryptomeria japonica]GLJ33172.1 hypothetical protein SUGI_0667920 [Cryptomeria japonica]
MAQLVYTGFLAVLLCACLSKGTALEHRQHRGGGYVPGKIDPSEKDLLEFPLNLEYLEAEFFLFGSLGYGLDKAAPELPEGGPPPIGGKKANLDPVTYNVILEFAYQEVGHLRAIKATVPGFPRPQLDLSAEVFANTIDAAFQTKLNPPFDPYLNSLNYLLASYLVPYVGLTGYVGTNPNLISPNAKRLLAGLLGVESGQDAVIRALLFKRLNEKVEPYPYTVAEFTRKLSMLRNSLGHTPSVDEGLVVERQHGAEGKVTGNILAGDEYSVAYARTPEQILRIVYSTGNESIPGGIYPRGGNGKIARSHIHRHLF